MKITTKSVPGFVVRSCLGIIVFAIMISSVNAAGTIAGSDKERVIKQKNSKSITTTNNRTLTKQNKGPVKTQDATDTPITGTKLKIIEFSKEFEKLSTSITVTGQQYLNLRWETNQSNATKGRWEARNKSNNNQLVASGNTASAPDPGNASQITIPPAEFLYETPQPQDVIFVINIQPLNAFNQPLGNASADVEIIQIGQGNIPAMTQFNGGAIFPDVEMIAFDEKIGTVKNTQIFFEGANVKLRVSNNGAKTTDSIRLKLKDFNVLMRDNSAGVVVEKLDPGKSKIVDIYLDAVLPAPSSQTPQAAQHRQWNRWYKDRCGTDLRVIMDWQGSQNLMPMDGHRETVLALEGWSDYATIPWTRRICANGQCVKMCDIEKDIHTQLDGKAVGYAFFAGDFPKFGSGGFARTSADGAAIPFSSKTKITVASVSKMVTAIAAVRILSQNNVNLNAAIGPFLPNNWNVGNYFQNVTFAQLLSQTSGIKDYGNVDMTYAQLQNFFEKNVNNNSSVACQPAEVVNPPNAVTPNNTGFCYSNYNTGLMRVILPRVAGFAEDTNMATRPQTLANQYEQLVQQNVFDLVGQQNVLCGPPGSNDHAFAYNYPGDKTGYDWGDVDLICGAAGWYLSVEDLAKVLSSINARDGKIFIETASNSQFTTLRVLNLGLDTNSPVQLEKNGGWSMGCNSEGANCGSISASASIFGPVNGPNIIGILFMNSGISGGSSNGLGARQVMTNAYNNALKPQ